MNCIEFYSTPEGKIMVSKGESLAELSSKDNHFISSFITILKDRYPEAYKALCKEYKNSKLNRLYYEFLIVRRFISCNFGGYDNTLDIDETGAFNFEYVSCPLRAECKNNNVICNPQFNTELSNREIDVMKRIFGKYTVEEISNELHLAIDTVKNHRRNSLNKLGLKSVTEFIDYAHRNRLFTKN